MRNITESNFKIADKPYDTSVGSWDKSINMFNINYSTILTKLIQEAGRWCERYASDLFIEWTSIVNQLSNPDYTGGTYVFGFREDGVDDMVYILHKMGNGYSTDHYRAVWVLEITAESDDDDITMKLGRIRL